MTTETKVEYAVLRGTDAILREGCLHNWNGCCWLCSDERPVWREMRLAAGLPSLPPLNAPRKVHKTWRERRALVVRW